MKPGKRWINVKIWKVRYGRQWRTIRIIRRRPVIRYRRKYRKVVCGGGVIRVRYGRRWRIVKPRRRRRPRRRGRRRRKRRQRRRRRKRRRRKRKRSKRYSVQHLKCFTELNMVRFRCLSQGRKSQNWGRRSLERKGRRGGAGIGGMGGGGWGRRDKKGKTNNMGYNNQTIFG